MLEILSLAEDVSENVCKAVIRVIARIGRLVSKEFFHGRILGMFCGKAEGQNWAIRKQCADSIV